MSLWDDKYQEKYMEIINNKNNQSKEEFINAEMETFVGTRTQIKEKELTLATEYQDKIREERKDYNKKINEIMSLYYDELYSYYDVPTVVLDKAYAMAYDRGHSYGHCEVESVFDDIVDVFLDVYNLGKEAGKGAAYEHE